MAIGQSKAAAQGAPLRERLRAWWTGETSIVPAQRISAATPPSVPTAAPVLPMRRDLVEPLAPWETPAMRIAQLAWGEGCWKPGGAEYVLGLAREFELDATKSVLEFGVGLGGRARALRRASGVWITGYEIDAELTRAAKQLSILAREEKGVEVMRYSAPDFAPAQGSFEYVLSTETLYRVARKEDLLIKFEQSLKHKGQIMITDYVRAPGVAPDDRRLKAFAANPAEFWEASRYDRHFRERSLDLRVSEDITASYRQLVLDGCRRFTEGNPRLVAHAKAYPEATVAFLDLWATRMSAFDSGLLKVMRFSVLKPDLKLMSNW